MASTLNDTTVQETITSAQRNLVNGGIMAYLGRNPGISNTVTGDLSGSILADGQISGGRINHKRTERASAGK